MFIYLISLNKHILVNGSKKIHNFRMSGNYKTIITWVKTKADKRLLL